MIYKLRMVLRSWPHFAFSSATIGPSLSVDVSWYVLVIIITSKMRCIHQQLIIWSYRLRRDRETRIKISICEIFECSKWNECVCVWRLVCRIDVHSIVSFSNGIVIEKETHRFSSWCFLLKLLLLLLPHFLLCALSSLQRRMLSLLLYSAVQ